MFDRERTDLDADTDIEFDFFDDVPTSETRAREAETTRPRRRLPRRPPGRPPTAGGPQLIRIVGVIVGAILLAVILVVVVKSCAGEKKTEYQNYMQDVANVGGRSGQIGRDFNKVITTPGIRLADLQARLSGLRQQQAQIVANAQQLKPPGPLRDQQQSLVEALQFRVSGLAGLAQAIATITKKTNPQTAGRELAQQTLRLAASDVVYEDLFTAGSQQVLQHEGIKGVAVPNSRFLQDPDLTSAHSWALIVQRLTQSPASGGLHGDAIVGVRVQPGNQTLSTSQENTVTASVRLAFQVLVKNSGNSQETQVQVNLNIQQSPQPIKKSATIGIINPGETKVVTFRNLGSPSFGTKVTVQASVEPVTGERNKNNNSADYPVVFTLG